MIRRGIHDELIKRLKKKRRFIQVPAYPQGLHHLAVAIEVKSGGRRESLPGMKAFARQFKPKRQLLVGGQGIPLEEFLSKPALHGLD